MTAANSLFIQAANTISQGLLIALYFRAVSLIVFSHNVSGIVAQQIIICLLIVLRLKKRKTLPFMPDEILVSLPYLWGMSVIMQAASMPVQMVLPSMPVFVLAVIGVQKERVGFKGGLRDNTLLQAIVAAAGFLLVMSLFLLFMLPAFDMQMYRKAVLGIYFSVLGIPVSLCAFSWLFRLPEMTDPR